MKSPEQGPNTESGFNRELLDLAEQIEKGTKWDRIPVEEARETLGALLSKYFPKEGLPTPEESGPLGEHNTVIDVMEGIEDGVKSGNIPVEEAISIFRALNEKYPVKKGEQS